MNKISSSMASVNSFNEQMKMQILLAKTLHSSGKNDSGATRSLFTALLDSDLPPHELETERLRQEASIVIGAGVETVAYSLTVCSYHVLSNPVILNRLKAELVTRIKDASQIPSFDTLRQFPYLTCVVNEALRFSYGTTQRMHRLSPTPMTYSHSGVTYYLPVGCVVSMDNYTASHDSWVFGSPYEFRPERWENDPRAPDGKPLTTYLISFGRGTRSCVGMQLAYAELYIGVASFFRRFDCELFETGRDAVDCYQDKFVPRPKPGTKGVRATVLKHA
jgi:cytochrome P450